MFNWKIIWSYFLVKILALNTEDFSLARKNTISSLDIERRLRAHLKRGSCICFFTPLLKQTAFFYRAVRFINIFEKSWPSFWYIFSVSGIIMINFLFFYNSRNSWKRHFAFAFLLKSNSIFVSNLFSICTRKTKRFRVSFYHILLVCNLVISTAFYQDSITRIDLLTSSLLKSTTFDRTWSLKLILKKVSPTFLIVKFRASFFIFNTYLFCINIWWDQCIFTHT